MKEIYRQGDVVLIKVNSIDSKAKEIPSDKGKTILAFGEVTGHAHALPASDAKQYKSEDKEFVEVLKETTLKHEEHFPITLPPGYYEKRIAREYSPAGARKVQD